VAEVQRADQQARDDLVADAQQQRGIEHVVRQRDRRAHRDRVAREQVELHAGRPCVTPSHIAGTPPATCAVAPSAAGPAARITAGKRSYGWCAESMSFVRVERSERLRAQRGSTMPELLGGASAAVAWAG
jgi:hypothetical protein